MLSRRCRVPPKSDANDLRADLDDGYARVANLLLEAASCAPLSGGEFRVLMFVVRRTYGWAQHGDRQTGKMDTMTAAEIAKGTGLPKGTVANAVGSLCRANVLLTDLAVTKNQNIRRYGVNPDVNAWGEVTSDWSMYRVTLKDARETYTYNRVDLYPNTGIPLPENRQRSTRNQAEVSALRPTRAGADDTLQTVNNESYSLTPLRGVREPAVPERMDTPQTAPDLHLIQPPPPEAPPEPTVADVGNALLQVWGLTHTDLSNDKPPAGRSRSDRALYFSAIGKLVEDRSAEELIAWASAQGPRELGTGQKAHRAIPREVRECVTASGWAKQFAEARESGGGGNGHMKLMMSDGTVTHEREWAKNPWEGDNYEYRQIVARETGADNWVAAKGVTKRPVIGLVCIDGYQYSAAWDEASNCMVPQRTKKVF